MGVGNTWFDFKQFRISQENCAMKVTTDACIQGAWTPTAPNTKRVLDIGTGTGLLALMLAQKNAEISVDAIEIDEDAAAQARRNVAESKWADRINIMQGDVKTFSALQQYDLIITNPPFFNNSLLSGTESKNKARHTLSLSYEELFAAIDRNLTSDGTASILLPYPESDIWEGIIQQKGWKIIYLLSVKHRDNAPVKRKVIVMSRNNSHIRHNEVLVIQEHDGSYTEGFSKLMAPYYLNL